MTVPSTYLILLVTVWGGLPLFQLRNGFGEVKCLVQGAWPLFTVNHADASLPPTCVSCFCQVMEIVGEADSPWPLSSWGPASSEKWKGSIV